MAKKLFYKYTYNSTIHSPSSMLSQLSSSSLSAQLFFWGAAQPVPARITRRTIRIARDMFMVPDGVRREITGGWFVTATMHRRPPHQNQGCHVLPWLPGRKNFILEGALWKPTLLLFVYFSIKLDFWAYI